MREREEDEATQRAQRGFIDLRGHFLRSRETGSPTKPRGGRSRCDGGEESLGWDDDVIHHAGTRHVSIRSYRQPTEPEPSSPAGGGAACAGYASLMAFHFCRVTHLNCQVTFQK